MNEMFIKAFEDIIAERRKVKELEGKLELEYEGKNPDIKLVEAAGCYALHGFAKPGFAKPPNQWPWPKEWWEPIEMRHRQVIARAAALLVAELERHHRMDAGIAKWREEDVHKDDEKRIEQMSKHGGVKNPLDYVATLEKIKSENLLKKKIFSTDYGWVRVYSINHSPTHPINAGALTYMPDGKLSPSDKFPSLFTVDIFEGTAPPADEINWPGVNIRTKVRVRDSRNEPWVNRLFCQYVKKPGLKFLCFEPPGGVLREPKIEGVSTEQMESYSKQLEAIHAEHDPDNVKLWRFCEIAQPVHPNWIKAW